MRDDGVLLAAKSLRTAPKVGARTAPKTLASIRREAELLRRYFDPRVDLVPYGEAGKYLVIMPAGLADLAHPPGRLAGDSAVLARVALAQVAIQLGEMHRDGLLHHDVKPSNIVMMPDGRVRLVDMGEACTPAEVEQPSTPAFSAPEWYDPTAEGSLKADVWSLGLSIAHVRLQVPERLWATSDDFLSAIIASRDLVDGLDKARREPALGAAPAPAPDDASERWAAYFRDFRAHDPQLAALILDRMLVDESQRADIAEVARVAAGLAAPGAGLFRAISGEEDQSPRRQALRLALELRLADEPLVALPQ